jgi:hypothetical protein
MRWRELVSTVSMSELAAKVGDGFPSENSAKKAMDNRIALKAQTADLASGYRQNLWLRESIATRRRRVITIYISKVRVALNCFSDALLHLVRIVLEQHRD